MSFRLKSNCIFIIWTKLTIHFGPKVSKELRNLHEWTWMGWVLLSPLYTSLLISIFLARERNGCFHGLFSSFQSYQSKVYRTCPWYRDNRRKASEYLIELENTTFNILLSLHSADLERNPKCPISTCRI